MANVTTDGTLAAGYHLDSNANLSGIACRYAGEAWVVGTAGTLLYTNDGGTSWTRQTFPSTNTLDAIATQDFGPVFVGGQDGFYVTTDTGATWTRAGAVGIDAIAAAQQGNTVLALGGGTLYAYENGALAAKATFAGARSVAVSADGNVALVGGNGLWRSEDAGATWTQLAVSGSFGAVRVGVDGTGVAVGDGGAIANIDARGVATVQHVGTADLFALHIPDVDSASQTGYAAGASGQVFVTHDSGATWQLGPNLGRAVYGIDEIGAGHL